jgi:uncharacterized repeat protein (TIGR03803 family)
MRPSVATAACIGLAVLLAACSDPSQGRQAVGSGASQSQLTPSEGPTGQSAAQLDLNIPSLGRAPTSAARSGLTAARTRPSVRHGVLYSFKGGSSDGESPAAGLININGTFYGTTWFAGSGSCSYSGRYGCGTVFSVTSSGTETMLYSFKGGGSGDGAYPIAGLLNVKGMLYGTTYNGGACASVSGGCGTVFSITPSGTETVLHTFKGGSGDGANPFAGLINVKGTLYGTTHDGGACASVSGGCGTVFSITPSGTETVLHTFKGRSGDGAYPYAGLINVRGTFYGTTSEGGTCSSFVGGCGTVFSLTPSGTETVLYSFKGSGSGDGNLPTMSLVDVKGTLYGTTYEGGANCGSSGGCGTVFSITPSGAETVLHSFGRSGDGANPYAGLGLLNVKGTLYGTTIFGGANGDGTVFAITKSGTETVFHSFAGGSGDGAGPRAGLISIKGKLYGTTYDGGANGDGTVFALKRTRSSPNFR